MRRAQRHGLNQNGGDTRVGGRQFGRPSVASDTDTEQHLHHRILAGEASGLSKLLGVGIAAQRSPGGRQRIQSVLVGPERQLRFSRASGAKSRGRRDAVAE